jgi:kynurenine formamidase
MERIIDLTYEIEESMFKYPSDPKPEIKIKPAKIEEEDHIIYDESGYGSGAGYTELKYHSANVELKLRNHHSTHIDFPAHKIPNGKTLDNYLLSKFIGNNCRIIDLSKILKDEHQIQTKHINQFLQERGVNSLKNYINLTNENKQINSLIIYTGFCDKLRIDTDKINEKERTKIEESFPYLSQNVAEYIKTETSSLEILGIDSFSFDRRGSNSEIHRLFLEKGVLLLETLVNLYDLSYLAGARAFELNCPPIIIKSADASPVRAYAIVK